MHQFMGMWFNPNSRGSRLRIWQPWGCKSLHAHHFAHVVQCRDGALKTRTVSVQIRSWAPTARSPMQRRSAQDGKVAGASPATRTNLSVCVEQGFAGTRRKRPRLFEDLHHRFTLLLYGVLRFLKHRDANFLLRGLGRKNTVEQRSGCVGDGHASPYRIFRGTL